MFLKQWNTMVCSHVFVICVTMFPHLEKDLAFSVFAGLRVWNIIYFPCSVDVPVQQGVGLHCIHHHSVLVIFKMSVLSLDGIKRAVGLHQHLCFYASIPHVFSTRQSVSSLFSSLLFILFMLCFTSVQYFLFHEYCTALLQMQNITAVFHRL